MTKSDKNLKYFVDLFLKFYNLSSIKTWRNSPSNMNTNFTELNHIFVKSSIFLIISEIIEKDYNHKVNYENFLDILIGHSLIRYAFKDINIELLRNIKKKDIIKFVIEEYERNEIELNNKDKTRIKKYYNDSLEKFIWNIASTITNKLDYLNIKGHPLNLKYLEKEIEKNFKIWENNIIKSRYHEKFPDIYFKANSLQEVYKFIYNSTIQQRWNGVDLLKKISIGEHQILVTLLFFKYLEIFESEKIKNEFNNKFIKYNLINLIFHDAPEVITKDINSPIKKNLNGLREILEKKLEKEALEENFFRLLPSNISKTFKQLNLLEPFEDRKIKNIKILGKVGKQMDDLTAFLEAVYNLVLGNKLPYIKQAAYEIFKKYKNLDNQKQLLIMHEIGKKLEIIEEIPFINYINTMQNTLLC